MREINKFNAFDEYVIRTPILSINEVLKLTKYKIKELCKISYVSEAIYIASPELHSEMMKFICGKPIKDEKKLIITLLKYLLRMGNRATPFGLFSGCSVGRFDIKSKVQLKDPIKHRRFTRLDMSYLCALSQKLEENKEIRSTLRYYPNTSIYKIGNKLRYIELKYEKTLRKHFTMSIDDSEYISTILDYCQDGASIKELANLIDEPDVTEEQAIEFVHELIDNQILISSISPYVTGTDYFDYLKKSVSTAKEKVTFLEINEILNKINNTSIGKGFEYYNNLYESIKNFNVNFNKKFLLQTDMVTTFESNTLDRSYINRINRAIVILNKLSLFEENEDLIKFKNDFYRIYEDEEIPLSVALDVESGIGYPSRNNENYRISPLIEGIRMTKVNKNGKNSEIKWTSRDAFLNKKANEALKKGKYEIEITNGDVKHFSENWNNIPDTFSVFFKILNNDVISLDNVGNITASAILGRFCHSDEKIRKLVEKIIEYEKEKTSNIYAEIVHLPEKRTGNVLFRPHLRDFEIPYLAKSNKPKSNQISIDDIMVSVRSDTLVLRSKKLNKKIIPRLATAHNHSVNSLPIYQFLGDIQSQGLKEYITFSWGNVHLLYDFFPRVTYEDIILSPAQWVIKEGDLKKIKAEIDVANWREKNNVPNKILFVDGDNKLPVDFEHKLSVEMFISLIKNKTIVILMEYLSMNNTLVKNSNTSFSHEIILSFYK